jgi:hypothetical protein
MDLWAYANGVHLHITRPGRPIENGYTEWFKGKLPDECLNLEAFFTPTVVLRDIAVQPGSENAVAIDEGEYTGIAIYDFNPISKSTTRRGSSTGLYTGTCLAFRDPNSLLAIDLYSSQNALDRYTVCASGLVNGSYPYYTAAVSQNMNCYKLDGGFIFSNDGGVVTSDTRATQVGVFEGMEGLDSYGIPVKNLAPDTSLGRVFFMTNNNPTAYSGTVDSITVYDLNTFLPVTILPMGFATGSGNTDPDADTNAVDLVRLGQCGLAALTTSGQLYLLRGAARSSAVFRRYPDSRS